MLLLVYIAVFFGLTSAQSTSGVCYWTRPRAGVVRDALYLEGGLQFDGTWQNNAWSNCLSANLTAGTLYKLNFSKPYDVSGNTPQFPLEVVPEYGGAQTFFVDGALFVNDNEFYGYGGMAYPTAATTDTGREVIHDSLYQANAGQTGFATTGAGLSQYSIPDGVNPYVTAGAGVSIPSEKLSFYFSGLESTTGGPLAYISNSTTRPTKLVTQLLKIDTSSQKNAVWSQTTLPSNVALRSESSMVWIPVGLQGSLFVIGGAINPADLESYSLNTSEIATADSQNPYFMNQIPVYDIASSQWYVQQTTGTSPPALAQACAVVAAAPDNSSYQIFVYGGYDGTGENLPSDDVWILSVPAFQWIRGTYGNTTHGRYGHACATPYPNQMVTVGGSSQYGNPLQVPQFIDVFDLNKLTWTSKYDPSKWTPYQVPSVVVSAIGGSPTGGANKYASGMDTNLANVFKTSYPGSLHHWYPYVTISSPKSNKWVVPVIASVVSVVGVLVIAGLLWCFCRPSARKRRSETASHSTNSRGRVATWLHGPAPDPLPPKSLASETTEVGDQISPRPNTYEVDSYFVKPVPELDTPSVPGSRMQSNTTSPAMSPGSHISVEAGGQPRSELAAHLHQPLSPHNHPLYPPSVFGHTGSQRSQGLSSTSGNRSLPAHFQHARSPTSSDPSSPYEMPHNRSDEDIPRHDLGPQASTPQTPPAAPNRPLSLPLSSNPPTNITSHHSANIPLTHEVVTLIPVSRSASTRPLHERNKSSLSSGISAEHQPQPPSPNPNTEYQTQQTTSNTTLHRRQQSSASTYVSSLGGHQEDHDDDQEIISAATSPERPNLIRETAPGGWSALPKRQVSAYAENTSSRKRGDDMGTNSGVGSGDGEYGTH